MVTQARMRPDDLAFAKGNAPLMTAPDLDPLTSVPIRSAERRRWAADLTGPALTGLVLHGAAGIGKSTLASQIVSRISHLEPERVTVPIRGQVSVDTVLGGVAAVLRRHPAVAEGGGRAQSVRAADRADLPWAHRLALLRELVLGQVPVLLVLDDFDDNVSPVSGGWTVRDPALAELIATWSSKSHRGRLLITCRHPFRPPRTSGPPLTFHHLGPLSRSGAFELAKSLPALGSLGEQELDRAWRLLGGHPQAMEYLDSLLATGDVRFPEVACRLAVALEGKSAGPAHGASCAHRTGASCCGVGRPDRPRPLTPRARRSILGGGAPVGRRPTAPPGGPRMGAGWARAGRTRAGRGGRGLGPGTPRVIRGARGRGRVRAYAYAATGGAAPGVSHPLPGGRVGGPAGQPGRDRGL
jgi:hypothetical protein